MASCGKKEEDNTLLLETETFGSTEYSETNETEPETTLPVTTEPIPTREPIQITKHPTGETVYPTARTWFIAHAENADTISWVFTEPETGKTYDHETVLSKHKCLETEILPEDTIALRNIPISMDGWTIQAAFSNGSETVLTDAAKISVIGIEQSYQRVIDFYYKISYYPDPDEIYGDPEFINNDWIFTLPELPIGKGGGSIGYCLKDITGDDVPEFIINTGYLRTVYTLKNGTIEKLLNSWSRSRCYLLSTGEFLGEGSSGAENSSVEVYSLTANGFEIKSGVWTDGHDEDGEIKHYRYVPGKEFLKDGERITRDEYSKYCEEKEALIVELQNTKWIY